MKTKSATERMEIARSAHLDTMTREMLWATIASRVWPSFLAPTLKPDEKFVAVLCIDSPAGRIAYRVTQEEYDMLRGHLELHDNDRIECSPADKIARLLHLATEGWN